MLRTEGSGNRKTVAQLKGVDLLQLKLGISVKRKWNKWNDRFPDKLIEIIEFHYQKQVLVFSLNMRIFTLSTATRRGFEEQLLFHSFG